MTVDFFSDYTMTINGVAAIAERTIDVINPASEETIAHAPDASREQLDQAVAAAKDAFPEWSARSYEERAALVSAIGDRIGEHAEDFKRLLIREQGKARAGAEWEIGGSIIWCHEIAKQRLEPEIVDRGEGHQTEVRRVPLGVIGGITPWNFPVLLAIWKIAPALLAGNTMVLKPSPYTPLCTLKLGEVLRDVLPAGVLNIVSGGNDLGAWMTSHPDIRKISFTGSTATGRKIMESSSANLKRITLELGGNDPAIVMPDVDVEAVAKELFWASFQNSAQFCVAAKRVYIHKDIYDHMSKALTEYASSIKIGDGSEQGTDLGPIQNKMQFEKLKDLLADARSNNLNFFLGGDIPDGIGYFVPITLVDNPPEESRVVTEEAFGPVLPLLKFDDIDDVIRRANDSEYGLAGSVWSNDVAAARKIAERMEVGTVWINEIHSFSPHIAFGGHKQSGIGIENALDGLREYTNSQTIVVRNELNVTVAA